MSNTIKKSLKRKKKAKLSRVKKQQDKDMKNALILTPKGIEMSQRFMSLAESPLAEIAQPSTGVYRDNQGAFMRVLSVSDRDESGNFTVEFCEVDVLSGLDTTEPEFQSAMEWAQMSLIYELDFMTD